MKEKILETFKKNPRIISIIILAREWSYGCLSRRNWKKI